MTIERWTGSDVGPLFGTAEERRAAVIRADQEQAASRLERLASQTSPLNDPEERIRIWEKLHDLRLPRSADHNLVRVIAEQTDLTVQLVQQEQRRRAAARVAPSAAAAVTTPESQGSAVGG
jgi:hypothetical protein